MSKHPRADLYLADRAKGMTYRKIAEKHGVSHQTVAQVCAKYSPNRFKPFTAEEVIYPNLRRWLNKNKVNKAEFMRRMGILPQPSGFSRMTSWMKGKTHPDKKHIDKILAVTGLTYEKLWEVEE